MTTRPEFVSAAVVFLAGAVLLFATAPHEGQFWWSDAPRNALNGVFVKGMDEVSSGPRMVDLHLSIIGETVKGTVGK